MLCLFVFACWVCQANLKISLTYVSAVFTIAKTPLHLFYLNQFINKKSYIKIKYLLESTKLLKNIFLIELAETLDINVWILSLK